MKSSSGASQPVLESGEKFGTDSCALAGEKAAKVSSTPGRTRAINFFALLDQSQRRKLVFADLPGYGYAKISKSISSEWPKFIEPYLELRETLTRFGKGSLNIDIRPYGAEVLLDGEIFGQTPLHWFSWRLSRPDTTSALVPKATTSGANSGRADA